MKKIEPFLQHILDSVAKIRGFVEEYSYEDFESDEKTHSAVVRQLEVIGEAVNHLEKRFSFRVSTNTLG